MDNAQVEYEKQSIKNATSTELISKLYDFLIRACHQKDEERVYKILSTLKKSLNFDFEISEDLYSIYEYCQYQAREQKFDEVRTLIYPIREAWIDGVVKDTKASDKPKSNGFIV